MKTPPDPKGTIQAAWERSSQVIDHGKTSGMLRQFHAHERIQVNGLPALKSDFEMGDGSRMLSEIVQASPTATARMTVICKAGAHAKYQKDMDQVVKSFLAIARSGALAR